MRRKDKNTEHGTGKVQVQLLEPAKESLRSVIELSAILASRSHEMPITDRKETAVELNKQIGNTMNWLDMTDSKQALLSSFLVPMSNGSANFVNLQPESEIAWEMQGCSIHLQIHNLAKIFNLKKNDIEIDLLEKALFNAIDKSRASALELTFADLRPLLRKRSDGGSFYAGFDAEGYGTPD